MEAITPKYIGLCGNPKSGKSEVQRILNKFYQYIPIDDGEVLRQFAMKYLGLSESDVYTQEGKAEYTNILGKEWQNRDILGTLGKQLEDMFGEHIMPFISTRGLDGQGYYSFGSVRKTQGQFFLDNGGLVIEIVNPGAGPSPYDFDKYDSKLCQVRITNDAMYLGATKEQGIRDLEDKVNRAMLPFISVSS